MSRFLLFAFTMTALLLAGAGRGQQADAPSKSALETKSKNSKNWIEIPQNQNFWKRVPFSAKAKTPDKNPWRFEKDDTLSCAPGAHEFFLYDKLSPNGVFHVEFRFKKGVGTGTIGICVRTSADGAIYHEAQFGPKAGGFLAGNTMKDGKAAKVPKSALTGPARELPPGEWNVCEVTAKDKTISVWLNGYVVADWGLCDVAKGAVALRVDNAAAEFRTLRFLKIR